MLEHPGAVLFVDSTHASASDSAGGGFSPDVPLATIDYAIGLCTANKGDVIYVMPGHTETVSAAGTITADIAGVRIIGLGRGSLKPTLTFSTATTATFLVSAANVLVKGFRLVCNIDILAVFMDLTAEWVTIEDCDFVTSSTKEALCFVSLPTTKDNYVVRNCTFIQPTDPAGTDGGAGTGAIYLVDTENVLIENCEFYGCFETAIIHNRTTACKNLWVKDCRGIQLLSGAEPFQLVTAASGAMLGGGFITPAETAATEATLVGTLGDSFFILPPGNFGNDGGAGGQGGIIIATAS